MAAGQDKEAGNEQAPESGGWWAHEALGQLQTVMSVSKANAREEREPGQGGGGPPGAWPCWL